MLNGTFDSLYIVKYNRIFGACCAYYRLADNVPFPERIVFNTDYHDTPTAVIRSEAEDQPEKFFHNGVLYIRRGDAIYDITGRKIRM